MVILFCIRQISGYCATMLKGNKAVNDNKHKCTYSVHTLKDLLDVRLKQEKPCYLTEASSTITL